MQILDVEQGSMPWHEARWGKVTGTRLKSALGSATVQKTLKMELVAERMCQNEIDDYCSPAMQWGKDNEPDAVAYAREERGIDFQTCGMIVSTEIENFAISPDAVHFEDNGNLMGGVECKCPNSSTHVRYLLDGVIPKDYYFQMIAPFLVCSTVEWWDFISYDPRSYSRKTFMYRLKREDIKELEEYRVKLIAFLDDVHMAHQSLIF